MKKEIDYLIIGSGLFGSVMAERISRILKKKVILIEKRAHIGGNCFSQKDPSTGIEYHKYGTHIFHTHSKKVLDYLNQFTQLNGYYHQVLTTHQDRVYQMPINLETINQFFGVNLRPFEVDDFLKKKIPSSPTSPRNLEEKAISQIGPELYEAFIKGYTAKQWQKDPRELPASIINRLPIRNNYNESYFNNDRYQGIPINGYTEIFEKMLDHPLIETVLNCDYFAVKNQYKVKEKIIYSGPIDRYFNHIYGKLDWRSVRFEKEVMPFADFQGTSVMNYADLDIPYTRIHEPKHLHPERKPQQEREETLIIKEYPHHDEDAPYYPIKDQRNRSLYQKYSLLAQKEERTIFGGRLGTYNYYDMDQVIAQALAQFEKLTA